MKFLVIGLGSMGKRRIRNLIALGHSEISGWDNREDRRKESSEKYKIKTFNSFDETVNLFKPDAFLISVNPDKHMEYAIYAYERNIHCFIEASVTDAKKIMNLSIMNSDNRLIFAPSCTMLYYPGPKKIIEILENKIIGEVLYINYHSGQYLPDWHPWEDIKEYYVSKRETGACREIVPFELTWLNKLLGNPKPIACVKDKLTNMDAEIDDIYSCIIRYGKLICNLTVDVISRPKAVREFRAIGTQGILEWSFENNWIRYTNTENSEWNTINLYSGTIEEGYINPEEPYINEVSDFIQAIMTNDSNKFPNSLENDYNVLQILYELEKINNQQNG